MRFLVDAQSPPALARWLAAAGRDAVHVSDVQLSSAREAEIWEYALSVGAAVVTKDDDFAKMRVLAADGPSIVWIRIPNSRRRELLAWFADALPLIIDALSRGETLIEAV
jgi:predicted nuclease of predicted toxin-antitoxin system